jgi:hypothetical protein
MTKEAKSNYTVFSTGQIRRVYCPSNLKYSGFEECPYLEIVEEDNNPACPKGVCRKTNRTCPQVRVSEKVK